MGKPEPARFRTWKGGELWAGVKPVGTCAREQDRVSSWRGFKICLRFQIIVFFLCVCGMRKHERDGSGVLSLNTTLILQ